MSIQRFAALLLVPVLLSGVSVHAEIPASEPVACPKYSDTGEGNQAQSIDRIYAMPKGSFEWKFSRCSGTIMSKTLGRIRIKLSAGESACNVSQCESLEMLNEIRAIDEKVALEDMQLEVNHRASLAGAHRAERVAAVDMAEAEFGRVLKAGGSLADAKEAGLRASGL